MKRYVFGALLCAVVALAGCQKNDYTDGGSALDEVGKVTLTANIAGQDASRVALTPEVNVEGNPIVKAAWETNEKFSIYYKNNGWNFDGQFTQVDGTNQFSGEALTPASGYMALYCNNYASESVQSYDFSKQDGTLDSDMVLMLASGFTSASDPLMFHQQTALMKFTFKVDGAKIHDKITRVVINNVKDVTSSDIVSNTEGVDGKITINRTAAAGDLYAFLPCYYEGYTEGHAFNFYVLTTGGTSYKATLTLPAGKTISRGKVYTATINLTQNTTTTLPRGYMQNDTGLTTFKPQLLKFIEAHADLTKIKFIANSATTGTELNNTTGEKVYLVANGDTLELHTAADEFVFNPLCSSMFSNLDDFTSIDFNNCINTSQVTTMAAMFYSDGIMELLSLDLSCFDTSNVTTMQNMFYSCARLTELDVTHFNTAKVDNMYAMFGACYKLALLDVSNFNTANVTDMSYMFANCYKLPSLDLRNFNTAKVTTMYAMFTQCNNVTSLDLRSFDFSKVTSFGTMFKYVGTSLPEGTKTQIYVTAAGYNVLSEQNTELDANHSQYVIVE